MRVPHRIETERLTLRCYEPGDAPELREVVTAEHAHLVEFMPWAKLEPQTLDEKLELILGFRSDYDAGRNFVLGIWERASGRLIGGTGLHPRIQPGGVELGYWLRAEREGQGFASEAVRALALVAFRASIQGRATSVLIIGMAPENERSERIPVRLGFQREGLLRRFFVYGDDEPRDIVRYSLLPEEYATASWRATTEASVRLFDALGRELRSETDTVEEG